MDTPEDFSVHFCGLDKMRLTEGASGEHSGGRKVKRAERNEGNLMETELIFEDSSPIDNEKGRRNDTNNSQFDERSLRSMDATATT